MFLLIKTYIINADT